MINNFEKTFPRSAGANRLRSKRSFSLMEVILAIVVLETIAVAMMGMMTFGTRAGLIHEEMLTAINLLQWKVEEIKARPFNTNVSEMGSGYPSYDTYTFNVAQTISYTGNPYLKKIDVGLTWINPLGVSKTEAIWFLMADY